MAQRTVIHVPPFTIDVSGCIVDILEILEHSPPWGKEYTVSLRVRCKGIVSRVFNITVRDTDELKAKIMAEIAKLKIMSIMLGQDEARKIVGGVSIA